jgi:hypothetical protein
LLTKTCSASQIIVGVDLELAAVRDDDLGRRGAVLAAELLNGAHDVEALGDLAENNVLAVEPRSLDGGDEELRTVGVGSSVGHGQKAGRGMLELKVLIGKLVAVDRFAASAVAAGKVASLYTKERRKKKAEERMLVNWIRW